MEIHQSNIKRKKRKLKFEIYFLLVIFLCGPILALKAIKETSIFQIKNIEISGIDNSEKSFFLENLKKYAFRPSILALLGDNNIFSWKSDIRSLEFLQFNNVSIEKDVADMSIKIKAEKVGKFGIWCFAVNSINGNCFWISSSDGVVLEEAPQTSGGLYPGIFEDSSRSGFLGLKIVEDIKFSNLKKILQELNSFSVVAEKIEYKKTGDILSIHNKTGSKLIFNLNFDPSLNLEALGKIIKKSSLKDIDYIDLSVEGKIYVKPK